MTENGDDQRETSGRTDDEHEMSEREPHDDAAGEPSSEGADETHSADDSVDDDVRQLLRAAMREEADDSPQVLEGFQRKVRARSGGKFYAEGWSTSKEPPISLFLLTTLVMLAIVFAVWAILGPLSGTPKPVDNTPAPVNVLSPVQAGQQKTAPTPTSEDAGRR